MIKMSGIMMSNELAHNAHIRIVSTIVQVQYTPVQTAPTVRRISYVLNILVEARPTVPVPRATSVGPVEPRSPLSSP